MHDKTYYLAFANGLPRAGNRCPSDHRRSGGGPLAARSQSSYPAGLSGGCRAVPRLGGEAAAPGDARRCAGLRGLTREPRSSQSSPRPVSRQVSARFRPPRRLPDLRRRQTAPLAAPKEPSGGTHPARGRRPPYARLEPGRRNRVLLRLLYRAGLRVSELCGLLWRDVQERGDAGQITVTGKGGKTRAVLLSAATWTEVAALRDGACPDAQLFRSRKGGRLDESQVVRIVRAAGKRADIADLVSPHWLRHAHASHALDRGCPIHLVQATLGHASVATTGRD